MSDDAFASFEAKWLTANPEQAIVAVFLTPDLRRRTAAFGTLVHELQQAAFAASDPQVSAVKLNWWAQELADVTNSRHRHPITRALVDEAAARRIGPALWTDLAAGAFAQVDSTPASTQADTVAALTAFYEPVARLESALLVGAETPSGDAAALWVGSHRLREVANPAGERAVSLDLLARHQLSRAQLVEASPQRAALLRDLLQSLRADIEAALPAAPASSGTRVHSFLDLDRIALALRADDPARALAESTPSRWRSLRFAWREARRATAYAAERRRT